MTSFDELDGFGQALRAPVVADPTKAAVVDAVGRASYAECSERASELARSLAQAGVGPGHAVVVGLGNERTHWIALLACWRIGATPVPLDPRATARERRAVLAALDFDVHGIRSVADAVELEGIRGHTWSLGEGGGSRRGPGVVREPVRRGLGMVQFSSGSSGRPKGILVPRSALLARARNVADALELRTTDRILCALPLSHSHGIDCLGLPSWLTGGTLHLLAPQAAAPTTVLALLERERITFFSSVPGFYDLAVRVTGDRRYDLEALRHCMCGSAALSPATARAFRERFGRTLVQGYGLAEIGPVTLNFAGARTGRLDAIGRAIDGLRCRLEPDGELVVSGEALAEGYLEADEWNARVRGGELFTGDLAEALDDGTYRLVGRRSRLINVDGIQVHPSEVELTLVELGWVLAAAVVDESAPNGRARLVAHVVLDLAAEGAPADEGAARGRLAAHVRSQLSSPKWPAEFRFADRLPSSSVGKVLTDRLGAGGEQ